MPRENLNGLLAFLVVARERSFTKAAALLGVSQSALSHTVRVLETQLRVRLLIRTTRAVSATEAGEQLINAIGPHFEGIEAELDRLRGAGARPAGTVRITAAQHAAESILTPKLKSLLRQFPEIRVEVAIQYALTDIAAERFDAGVRLGEQVAKDMVAVRIGPDFSMAVVATPEYFETHPVPKAPADLTAHNCINLRLPTYGGIYAWEFEKGKREVNVRVEGQLTFNTSNQIRHAAISGMGLAYLPEDAVAEEIGKGRLKRVLQDWCAPFPGYHLYYPSRRHVSPAFTRVVDALRFKR